MNDWTLSAEDRVALAHALIDSIRRQGGQVAAGGHDVLLMFPPDATAAEQRRMVEACSLARVELLGILHTRQALQRAAHFAAGCRWPTKARNSASVAPACLRRPKGA